MTNLPVAARLRASPIARALRPALLLWPLLAQSSCVIAHSRQALSPNLDESPPPRARFVQEEDSGLSLGGFIQVAEADHYAVLLARMREHHRCKRITAAQLDYYTDHWILVAFPIARLTALCEPADPDPTTPVRP